MAGTFGRKVIVAASMQDVVLSHLFAQVIPDVEVLFLQTGYYFAKPLQTRDRAIRGMAITVVEALTDQRVAEQAAQYGEKLYARDLNLCCRLPTCQARVRPVVHSKSAV